MTKKIAAILSMASLFLFTVFAFIPFVFKKIYWKTDTPGGGIATRSWERGKWLFERYPAFGMIILALALAAFVVALLYFLDKDTPSLKGGAFLPAVALVLLVWLAISVSLNNVPEGRVTYGKSFGYYGYYAYKPHVGFYLMSLLLVTASVFNILLALGKLKDEPLSVTFSEPQAQPQVIYYVPKETPNEMEGQAFELIKKYKDLLDNDVITQEEYETKKKELLGL